LQQVIYAKESAPLCAKTWNYLGFVEVV